MSFLIAHGALVWIALLAILVTLSVIAAVRVARVVARRAAASDLALRAEAIGRLAPGRVVLRGTLRGGSLASVSRGLYAETVVTFDVASDAPWLELDDGTRVDFAAPVRVELGTRGAWPRAGWPADAPASAKEPLDHARGPVRWHAVASGDVVLVRGVARAATQSDGYRGDGATTPWTLVAERSEPITMAACTPAITPRPAHPFVMPLVATGLAIVWAALLYGAGEWALARQTPAIALAMPGTRDEALVDIRARIAETDPARAEVVDAIGDCASAYEEMAHARYAEAADSAGDCPASDDIAFTAMLAAGEYERARSLGWRGHLQAHLTAAIATEHWMDAAADARMIARRLEDASMVDNDHVFASDYACFGEYLRAVGGATDAFGYTPQDRVDTATCRLFRAAANHDRATAAAVGGTAAYVYTMRLFDGRPVAQADDFTFERETQSPATILFAIHTPAAQRLFADPKRAYGLVMARLLAIGR